MYHELPDDVRQVAENVLTRKQLTVFQLWCNGLGSGRIAIMLDISEPVARRTLERSRQKIRIEIERTAA